MRHTSSRPARSPCVEPLEGRRLLTAVLGRDGAGLLQNIATPDGGQTAGLTLTVQEGNKLTVAEGETTYGTFKVAKNLTVSLGDTEGGFVNRLDLNNLTLTTNVRVAMGDTGGLNQFRLTTKDGGTGTLRGDYAVRGGDTGSEFVVFGDFGQTSPRTINVTGSVRADMGGGGDDPNSEDPDAGPPDAVSTVGTGPANTILHVGGNFTATDSTVLALRGSVGGNLFSDSSAKPVGQLVLLGNFSQPLTVGGAVAVKTGTANDSVEVQAAVVRGDLYVRTGYGDDAVIVTSDVDLTGTLPTRVGGNLVLDLGVGDDTAEITRADVRGKAVSVAAGAGNDAVTVTALNAPAARADVLLGAGDDSFHFAPGAAVSLVRLLVDGGAGADAYDAGEGNHFAFPVQLQSIP